MALREKQEYTAPRCLITKLPPEVWDLILLRVAPSQLTVLAQVSRTFNQIVRSLSVWHTIWSTAKLASQETSNEHQDFYEDVLASSTRICEGCYSYLNVFQIKYTFSGNHTELLRTSRFNDTKTLCSPCNTTRIELWEKRQQELLDKRQEELERFLVTRLKAKRCNASLLPEEQLPYRYSGEQEDMQATIDYIFRESVHPEFEVLLSRRARQSKLTSKLELKGIQFRKSRQTFQSSNYVKYGRDTSLDTAVQSIARSDWLRRNTEYESIRLRAKVTDQKSSSFVKEEALKRYIRTRFQSNQWSHVRDDPDTLVRPPSSLWSLIEELSPTVCEEYALHCIYQYLHTLSRNLYPLEYEDIMEAMNIGAWISRKYSLSASLLQLPLSEGLRWFLGARAFHTLLKSCRAKLCERKQ